MGNIWEAYGLVLLAFAIGFFKAATAAGTGVFTSSLASIFLEPRIAIPFTAPLMFFSDLITLHLYRGFARTNIVAKLLPSALIGTISGSWLLQRLTGSQVRVVIAFFAISFVLHRLYNKPISDAQAFIRKPLVTVAFGFFAGVFSGFAHVGGTVITMYLLLLNLKKDEFIATMVQLLLFINLIKLGSYLWLGLLPGHFILIGILLIPFLVLGGVLAQKMNRRLSDQRFTTVVLAIIWVSGIVLLIR